MPGQLPTYNGIILDATALIDFRCLRKWRWLRHTYAPLYVAQEVIDSDAIEEAERTAAQRHLMPLVLEQEEEFETFARLRLSHRLLSAADRSTVALALHRKIVCFSDDQGIVDACDSMGVGTAVPQS